MAPGMPDTPAPENQHEQENDQNDRRDALYRLTGLEVVEGKPDDSPKTPEEFDDGVENGLKELIHDTPHWCETDINVRT